MPLDAGEIFEKLNKQFNQVYLALALRRHKEFAELVGESVQIARDWKRHEDEINGTTRMGARAVIEMGFAALADYIPTDTNDNDFLMGAIDDFVAIKNKERIPYRAAQYGLRGIPISVGINHD